MRKITTQQPCKRCERSSTYVKKKLGYNKIFYVCSNCGYKLCREGEVMEHLFTQESKPVSNKARQFKTVNPKKNKHDREDFWD